MLRREQGRLDEAEDLVRRSVDEFPKYPIYRCADAQMAQSWDTRPRRARRSRPRGGRLRRAAVRRRLARGDDLACRDGGALRDVERAALYRRLLPYGERVAIAIAAISTGAVARSSGFWRRPASVGTTPSATSSRRSSNGRIGARPWLAHTQRDYAQMLLARDRLGDSERALELAGRALEGYRSLGMDSYAAEAARLERALRAAPAR